mgnify:FL=1
MTEQLIQWYNKNRRILPWRENRDPYKIWVSEIILQQTQIITGIPYFKKFIKKFPTIKSLAISDENTLLKIWEGLGYYNRALNMLSTAKMIVSQHNCLFPKSYQDLIKLKGIGPYTAAAISSICFDTKIGVVDGNVYRVLTRYYNISNPINQAKTQKKIQRIANKLVPSYNPGIYNQAIMDFGAIQCKKYHPQCQICPLKKNCQAFQENTINLRPVKIIRKHRKVRYLNYLLIVDEKSFIIKKRGSSDVWGKMYELPLIETQKEATKELILHNNLLKGNDILETNLKTRIVHNLSHQKLKISFWIINKMDYKSNSRYEKIHRNEIKHFPFPKPIQQFLQLYWYK